jgi:hypothetical protein
MPQSTSGYSDQNGIVSMVNNPEFQNITTRNCGRLDRRRANELANGFADGRMRSTELQACLRPHQTPNIG